MAQVILTPEEEAAVQWLDLSDEALGKLVRTLVSAAGLIDSERQKARMSSIGGALMLLYEMDRTNAAMMEMRLNGHTITVVSDDYEPDEG